MDNRIGIFLLLVVFFVQCKHVDKQSNVDVLLQDNNELVLSDSINRIREITIRAIIENKKMHSIDSILTDSCRSNENKVLLLCRGLDCGDCVNHGFRILEEIASKSDHTKTYVIEIPSPREINATLYDKTIYLDSNGAFHAELSYVETPILLVLDPENRVVDLHRPFNIEAAGAQQFIVTNSY